MRIIKFRGKRIDNGEWVYGYLIELWTKKGQIQRYAIYTCSEYSYKEESLDVFEVDPETVGQYIGRKDKKIYEGDIMRVLIGRFQEIGVIEWNEDEVKFGWRHPKDTVMYELDILAVFEPFEIIGNIHDNPELKEVNNENDKV